MAAIYYLRPRTVQAIQFTAANDAECVTFGDGAVVDPTDGRPSLVVHEFGHLSNKVRYIRGASIVHPGDWIVKDELGHFRVIKGEEFAKTYTTGENNI